MIVFATVTVMIVVNYHLLSTKRNVSFFIWSWENRLEEIIFMFLFLFQKKMVSLFNFPCCCSFFLFRIFKIFDIFFEKSGFVTFCVRYREIHVCSCSNLEFLNRSITVNQVTCQIASVISKAIRFQIKVYQ